MATTMAASAGALALGMTATWALSLRCATSRSSTWPGGSASSSSRWIAFATGDGDGRAARCSPARDRVWGLRSPATSRRRKLRRAGEDHRYAAMRERHGDRFRLVSLVIVFGLPGRARVGRLAAACRCAAAPDDPPRPARLRSAWRSWALGLAFEAVGDAQLARFKADPANNGQVMDRGLWRYTRHPNYFGDFWSGGGSTCRASTPARWWTRRRPAGDVAPAHPGLGQGPARARDGRARPGYARLRRAHERLRPVAAARLEQVVRDQPLSPSRHPQISSSRAGRAARWRAAAACAAVRTARLEQGQRLVGARVEAREPGARACARSACRRRPSDRSPRGRAGSAASGRGRASCRR